MFSPPLNSWRQHFNAQGDEPARFVALTDAPVMINRFRNLDFVLNNNFALPIALAAKRATSAAKAGKSPPIAPGIPISSPIFPDFGLMDHSARGQGARGILLHFAANTMSAHIEEYPVGTYPRAHWHGPGAHILILSGAGYSLLWEPGKSASASTGSPAACSRRRPRWFHQHFNPGKEPARYLALKPWGFTYQVEDLGKDTGSRSQRRHADRLPRPGPGDTSNIHQRVRQTRRRSAAKILEVLKQPQRALTPWTCAARPFKSLHKQRHDAQRKWIVVMDLNVSPFLLEPSKDSEQSFKNSPSPLLVAQAALLLCAVMTLGAPRELIAQEQILVGYDGHAGFQGPIWATKDLGLFEKHGLDGELILIPGSARGMAALLSGHVPFIRVPPPRRWRRSCAAAMSRWSPRPIINCR